jgi:hypothetical protein
MAQRAKEVNRQKKCPYPGTRVIRRWSLWHFDEFAEFGAVEFVSGEPAAVFFEGFEDGQGAGEIFDSPVKGEEVALEVGAIGFGLGEML